MRRFRGSTTDSAHARPVAPNVLARDFSAQAPNVAWVGDITYLTIASEWALDEHMRTERGRLTPRWSVNKGEGHPPGTYHPK
jgi:transposase InsO family protein